MTHYVYVLTDPRFPLPDDTDWQFEYRYVGLTTNIRRRRWQHLRAARLRLGNPVLGAWIRGLLKEGLRPDIYAVRVRPTRYGAEVEEAALIRSLRQTGYYVLNVQHNRTEHRRRWPKGRRLPKRKFPQGKRLIRTRRRAA